MPHVVFLHERFLFRFGHDRTMLLHGRELVRRGWRVSFVTFRADEAVIAALGGELILLPEQASSYAALDDFAAVHLRNWWAETFAAGVPDVAVNGGWPFFQAQAVLEEKGVPSVFFDAGATPIDERVVDAAVHRRLAELRRDFISRSAATVSVSEFIAVSQTRRDAPATPNHVVLNGVDHLDDPIWTQREGHSGAPRALLARLAKARRGRRLILNLGRWEEGYKNRSGAIEVLRDLLAAGTDALLVVLADERKGIPAELADRVFLAGHPDDQTLRAMMLESDVGISPSLWEGFNLPLAEMHYLGRPAFALDIGGHPEAAIDRRFLCGSIRDMAAKVTAHLDGRAHLECAGGALDSYRARMSWSRASSELEQVLVEAVKAARRTTQAQVLVMDVTNASRDPANSGVVRVTRRLARELQDFYRCLFVVWDEGRHAYRLPDRRESEMLRRFGGPRLAAHERSERAVPLAVALAGRGWSLSHTAFLYAETVLQSRARGIADWLARERVDYCAVLHDLIPLTHPEFTEAALVERFPDYLVLLEGARVLIANSETTARSWSDQGLGGPLLAVETLPGDFGPRGEAKSIDPTGEIRILTVSTLEPRKNHRTLLEAFGMARRSAPELQLRLDLVGNAYEGAGDILSEVRSHASKDCSIRYHGVVDDARLRALYAEADFTVYPSLVEGFGLPILESAWRIRPFICHDQGAMAELAASGGGLACDMRKPDELAQAIISLARDGELYARLAASARLRQVRTWRAYARACLAHALGSRDARGISRPERMDARSMPQPKPAGLDLDALLYPGKPSAFWQMSDSERMAFTGLLSRWRPKTYFEIGTYHGGSALLASEFAQWVVTIDIDPTAGERFEKPANVTFFAGRSQEVVPGLLDELASRDLYPDFVLIDGEHSTDGVRRDLEFFLTRRPPRPLLVVFHDSFNPECRRGIAEAAWLRCPWFRQLDLDFVPGRIVEGEGDRFQGQMWGGLAVALLTPEESGPPPIMKASSDLAYRRALAANQPA